MIRTFPDPSPTLVHTVYITLGDPYDDGHGETKDFILKCNYTAKQLGQFLDISRELTGINFSTVCEDYEQSSLTYEEFQTFLKFGCPFEEILENFGEYVPEKEIADLNPSEVEEATNMEYDTEGYIKLLMWYLSLSLPRLKYTIVLPDPKNAEDVFQVSLGYGLFS